MEPLVGPFRAWTHLVPPQTLALNIQNLMNEKAPYDPGATYLGYNTGLHNPYGRYFTISASYKFR